LSINPLPHYLSQAEIASDNPCSQHLSGVSDFWAFHAVPKPLRK
jgi:hypothetical protein